MHIAEGVLSAPVLITGAALSAAGVAVGLRRMDYDRVPQVALLACAFFIGSLIHVPIGPASGHLLLSGLVGVVLGWAAFPAMLVALFLQAVLWQYGGLTTLGVNTFNMAAPAVVCYYLFNSATRCARDLSARTAAFLAGALGVALAGALTCLSLVGTRESLRHAALALLIFHAPVMIVEGLVTAAVVAFLRRTRPELLLAPLSRDQAHV